MQNSVFEGELTEGKYKALKHELRHVIDDEDDSVLIYVLRTKDIANVNLWEPPPKVAIAQTYFF